MMSEFFDRIRRIIAIQDSDQFEFALAQLLNFLKGAGYTNEYYIIIIISSKYYRLKNDIKRGLINREFSDIEFAKINFNLLETIKDLEKILHNKEVPISLPANILIKDSVFERIIGLKSTIKKIAWLAKGLESSKSVCKIINYSEGSIGTGFLVENGWLITNNHVVKYRNSITSCKIIFNYVENYSGVLEEFFEYNLDPDTFETNAELDITRVKVKQGSSKMPLNEWGRLSYSNIPVELEQHVTIIQHPQGAPKQIALNENKVINIFDFRIQYTTDTEPGSSGSPVFNDNWEVVAIHHAGGNLIKNNKNEVVYTNEGISMKHVREHFSYW